MHMSFTGERYVPELRGQIYYEHFHRYALVLELARGKDVLDIACGEGYGTAALALVARSAVGIDNDVTSVRHAAARYTAMNIDFRTGECADIPVAEATADLVVSFETIEHLTQHEKMLAEIRRVLRPGGHLVMSSPNKLIYSDRNSVQNPFHVRELYFHEFRDMLRSFFPQVRVFGQRIFAASAVHPLRGPGQETRWLGPTPNADAAMSALPDPEYFVAVCGTVENETLPDLCSVYLDPRDELLADVRSNGLATLSGGHGPGSGGNAAIGGEYEAQPRVLEGSTTPSDDERSRFGHAERRADERARELAERERELADRVEQVRRLEAHIEGIESLLGGEQRKNAELEARVTTLLADIATDEEQSARRRDAHEDESRMLVERLTALERSATEEQQRLATRIDELAEQVASETGRAEELERESATLAGRCIELQTDAEAMGALLSDERRHNVELTEGTEVLQEAIAQERERAVRRRAAHEDEILMLTKRLAEVERVASEERPRVTARIDELCATLAAEIARADQLERERAARTVELDALHAEGDAALVELAAARDECAAVHAELGLAHVQLVAARSELDAARDELQRTDRLIAGLRLELQSAEESSADELRVLRSRLQSVEQSFAEELRLREPDTRAAKEAREQLETVRAHVDELRSQAAAADHARRAAEQTVAQLQLEHDELHEVKQRAVAAEALLADIVESHSWKMTLPARRLMGALRRRNRA